MTPTTSALFLASAPDSISLDWWTWVALFGCALVIPGVILESAEYVVKWGKKKSFLKFIERNVRPPAREEYERLAKWLKPKILKVESLGFFLLILGLAIEILGSFESDRAQSKENSALYAAAGNATNMAAQAIKKAHEYDLARAVAEQQTAIIQSNNLVLQKKLQQRNISEEQITNFIFLTQKIPKIPIRIGMGTPRDEVFTYAIQVRSMIEAAGFKIPDSDTNLIEGIHQDPSAFNYRKFTTPLDWPDIQIITDTTNSLFGAKFSYESAGGFQRPVVSENDTNGIYVALSVVLQEIKIPVTWAYKPDWVSPAHCEFYILQKPQ